MPPEYEVRVRNNATAKYLQKSGYSVKIFSASTIHNTKINLIKGKSELFSEKQYGDLNFVHIRVSNYSGNGFSRVINMLQFPLRLAKVVKNLNEKPDVIVCDSIAVLALIPYHIAKKYKARFILEIRDLWPESFIEYKKISRKNPITQIMYQVEKYIYRKSNKLIFSMEGGKDYIIDKGWDKHIELSKIFYINNGVDLDEFNYNRKNHILNDLDLENSNIFKVVYTGSIRLVNNVKKIIDAAQEIRKKGYENIIFLIFGDGTDKKYLQRYCAENKIENVIFKGFVDKDAIPYILSRCDLNVIHFEQNNLKKYGASLNKMFEYFASGKPTISDCEFGYDIIKKYKCGVVCDNANSDQLSQEIISFYNMTKEKYLYYCKNALLAAQDFDYKKLTQELEKVIIEK